VTSRWNSSAPDADIVTLDPRFASISLAHSAIGR
jgi:hypothetical protein